LFVLNAIDAVGNTVVREARVVGTEEKEEEDDDDEEEEDE
jgi:hypothetical protein